MIYVEFSNNGDNFNAYYVRADGISTKFLSMSRSMNTTLDKMRMLKSVFVPNRGYDTELFMDVFTLIKNMSIKQEGQLKENIIRSAVESAKLMLAGDNNYAGQVPSHF